MKKITYFESLNSHTFVLQNQNNLYTLYASNLKLYKHLYKQKNIPNQESK